MNAPIFRPSPDELTQETATVAYKLGTSFWDWLWGKSRLDPNETIAQLTDKKKVLSNLSSVTPCAANQDPRPDLAHSGECSWCHKVHNIARSPEAVTSVKALHADLMAANNEAHRDVANTNGKMIGVLVCKDQNGVTREMKAFSGPPAAIVNVNNDWSRLAVAPSIENFVDDPTKPANMTSRPFVPADMVDNNPGQCAAQKLLFHVAEYNKNEGGRQIAALQQQIDDLKQQRADLFDNARGMSPDNLRKWVTGLTESEMEKLDLTPARQNNLLGDPSPRATDLIRQLRTLAVNRVEPELPALERSQINLEKQIADIRKNPPKLIPVGLAEAWIGKDKGGFPPKKNGEIIDSCYTCHKTLGDVLCGLQELQERYGI